jgi:hypothetical protein
MLQAYVSNVSSVFLDVCYECFYLDVVYVSHICLQVFLSGCCICFVMAFQVFLGVSQVLQTHVSSVSSFFRRMLQKFHLDISKVDRCCTCCNVTHLPQPPAVAAGTPCMRVGSGGMECCAAKNVGSGAGV